MKPHLRFSPLSFQDIVRFWKKVSVGDNDECWEWQAGLFDDGYGAFGLFGKNYRAHRVAYYIHHKVDPEDLKVCHHCDNPPCCNPHHLFKGSNQDNMLDARRKGRLATGDRSGARQHPEQWHRGDDHWTRRLPDSALKGERNGRAQLSENDVIQMIKIYQDNPKRGCTRALADTYKVDITSVQRIVKGKQWKHVFLKINGRIPLP